MVHLFVVNPAAGRRDATPQIESALARFSQLDARVYRTACPGDATRYVRAFLEREGARARLYACGGDGTLSEVINGAAGFTQASVGCYPCGSGNDFVKYYGAPSDFLDVKALVEGVDTPVDLIRVGDRYAINACHFGFDTMVAQVMTKAKALPFVGGRGAYALGVGYALLLGMRSRCTLTCDGEPFHDGAFLLCTIANGAYVGGSYRCAPRSLNDDGMLEICLVKPVSRARFLRLMGAYQRGEHLDDPRFSDVVRYRRARSARLTGPAGFSLSLDGEVTPGSDFPIQGVSRALKFIVPRRLAQARNLVVA